jgi:hypothetical protein
MSLTTILQKLGIRKGAPPTRLDQMSAALHTSLVSIIKHAAPDEQATLLDETLEQFRDAVFDAMADEALLTKAGKIPPSESASFGNDDEDEDEDVADEDADEGDNASAPSDDEDADATDDSEEEDDEMDQKLRKQYEDRIAALEGKLQQAEVTKADVTALQAQVTKFEQAETERASLTQAREVLGTLATEDEVAKVAEQIRKGFDVSVLAPIAKQREAFAKAAMLTTEVGSGPRGADAASPMAPIAKAAADFLAQDPTLTQEQAIAKALDAQPHLYDAMLASSK